jgi:hypothetical protein
MVEKLTASASESAATFRKFEKTGRLKFLFHWQEATSAVQAFGILYFSF